MYIVIIVKRVVLYGNVIIHLKSGISDLKMYQNVLKLTSS